MVRILAITVIVIMVVAAVIVAIAGWGWIKPYATNQLSAALGREVTIQNIAIVELSLTPRIRLDGVKLENAGWSDRPYMAEIRRLTLGIDLLQLIQGQVVLSGVKVQHPRLYLAVSRKGRRNWAIIVESTQQTSDKDTAASAVIPIIDHWRLSDGRLSYRNLRTDTSLGGTIAMAQGEIEGAARRAAVRGNGRLEGKPWRMTAALSSLLERGDEPQRSDVHAEIAIGDTQGQINGSILNPLELKKFELDFTFTGPDTADLKQFAAISLPRLPPFQLEGHLKRDGALWSVRNLTGRVGVSDIAGDVSLNAGVERMLVRADLVSDKLDFVQIFGEAKPSGDDQVIPDTTIDFSPLKALDAQVEYEATRLYVPGATFANVSTELVLKNGRLLIDPLRFAYLGGTFNSRIEVAMNQAPAHISLNAELQRFSLRKILARFETAQPASGNISGHIDLQGKGRSPADFSAAANGNIWLVMNKGSVDAMLLEMLGLDIGEMLILGLMSEGPDSSAPQCTIVGPWCRKKSKRDEQEEAKNKQDSVSVPIRCLVADFKVRDGVMTAQTLVLSTTDTKVIGSGSIALGSESVDLKLLPRSKDFSVLEGGAPIHVHGGLKDLNVNISKARIALSLLTPVELGIEKAADCQQLIRTVHQQE